MEDLVRSVEAQRRSVEDAARLEEAQQRSLEGQQREEKQDFSYEENSGLDSGLDLSLNSCARLDDIIKSATEFKPHNSEALVPDENLLAFGLVLFFLSLIGILFNKQGHMLIMMLFFELMLYSLSFTAIIFSLLWGYPQGQIFALLIMSVAVAESSIGLGLLIIAFRSSQRIDFDEFSYIKA